MKPKRPWRQFNLTDAQWLLLCEIADGKLRTVPADHCKPWQALSHSFLARQQGFNGVCLTESGRECVEKIRRLEPTP